ncbi:hypothetical protein A3B05_02710 [Candidatus Giovannonibacteria bacterium RIFCSPLOWO2_01_FULL_43_160]|uniref:Uncharacterized protein n=2 Tax=Candidatus Giovannoniibacteriota TaxID=1752738 RepID=A0A0G1ITC3_9BACT|nr:MAG: hypothetical protein UV72_C0012G0006 [Candidatus Giovannonibacteria bacterium GW2011_GWB1_43_13]KKS99413.1 MAG: hypothetical protein UV75_C0005G0030 [Candidatus Giovannonibacteria bacterium GW2011_GWA1_43_15]KKT20256.1 MAG: hypothetical protein UW05_C0039G0007 [Candidatus Giovannonibacteria bacterium GW2011_GWC2_43_8]KKT62218.1 MAG: hypothetical protein UW55_C0015G0006 [Candidatus Giovannonibacteria bacterium GW2011_GWA2_44_26]OGF59307.1 MAG: hypothetical protein A2652_01440 [Candidatus
MKKNITTIIIVSVLVVAGIWWWVSSGGTGGVPINIPGTSGPTLQLVDRLKNIKIDTSFFNDQEFLNLEAAPKTDISSLSRGRSNPFTSRKK